MGRRTSHVAGRPVAAGGSGDPSRSTALGVKVSIEVVCEEVFGSGSLEGRRLTVIGLGAVGAKLAAMCAREGAQLVVADIDNGKQQIAADLGAKWSDTGEAVLARCDILVPCALGGILGTREVANLRARAIVGAANNQLSVASNAEVLHRRGILWAPDFVVNAGGLIHAVGREQHGFSLDEVRRRVLAIGDALQEVLAEARRLSITPLEAAMRLVARRLEVGTSKSRHRTRRTAPAPRPTSCPLSRPAREG